MISADKLGKARRIDDAKGRYIEFCKSTLPRGLKLNDLHVVLDCSHGATYQVAPSVFQELGAKIDVIHADPDGLNINQNCGSTCPELLQARVIELGADMGIAFDGDGDRVLFVDHTGELVDGDELLFVISAARHQLRGCNGVVGTLMSNYGMELAFQRLGIPFSRAGVGDRYVLQMMREKGWLLGGESSGHIICGDVTTTGDGVVSALQVVNALHILAEPLAQAKLGMSKLPQTMINVRLDKRVDACEGHVISAAIASAEGQLAGKGRVLLRPSGTEPLVRVMVEGEDLPLVNRLAQELADIVQRELTPSDDHLLKLAGN
jgi:phosphoglucosamine mutase